MKTNLFAASLAAMSKASIVIFALVSSLPCSVRAANLVQNGSLEDLNSTFVNTSDNYMALGANATAIAGWTVSPATTSQIVWGKSPTTDGYTAADGTFFVDLTGFGSNSPNGAIQQSLQNLIVGQQYSFSLDVDVDGSLPLITVDGGAVALSAGTAFKVGNTTWTPESGVFTADATDPLLKIMNQENGQQIDFIDNIAVNGPSSVAPEPTGIALFGIALLVLYFRIRQMQAF